MTLKPTQNWSSESSAIPLTPEDIIEWLEGHRALMIEVWTQNPELRKQWEKLNETG